jgi:nitrate reductase (cytochrome), electron transfer subunit
MEPDQSRRIQIVLATLLMAATVYALGNNLLAERRTAELLPARDVEAPALLREAGMFEEMTKEEVAAENETPPPSKRDLNLFYSRRAYPGAPPRIPHMLLDKRGIGGKSCNGCHLNGGYVPAFSAYTPVTPHPTWSNCLSCHVSAPEQSVFRPSEFVPASRPTLPEAALPGGPPPVPHSLDYRTNCRACHGGPAAVKEIRTSHPERQNCRQCHVSSETVQLFARP